MRHRAVVPAILLAVIGMTSCARVAVTASRSDSDAWAGCDNARAMLDTYGERESSYPLAPLPRLRPYSMIEPCRTVLRELDEALRQLAESGERERGDIGSTPGPEDVQLYE